MTVGVDAAGNLRGVYPGSSPRPPRLFIGSHLDTVVAGRCVRRRARRRAGDRARRWAGRIAACRSPSRWSASPRRKACASACPSSAAARSSAPRMRNSCGRRDAHGRSIADAIRDYGLDPSSIAQARVDADAIGYVEFHIEQGPVLDGLGVPLAVVDAIAGQSRFTLTFTGSANHAGTTPMHARRDALAGAAEWIGRVESLARDTRGLVATVGRIKAVPGATNVIVGQLRGESRRAAWRRRRARRCGRDAAGRGSPDRVAAGARRRLGHDARPAVSRDESGAGGDARTRGPRPRTPGSSHGQRRRTRRDDHGGADAGGDAVPAQPRWHQPPSGRDRSRGGRGRRPRRRPRVSRRPGEDRGCDRPRRPRRDARHPERPAAGRRGDRGRPHSRGVAGRRGRRRGDRRPRTARAAGRHRRAPALQRAGPHRVGGRGHRKPGAGRRRRHALLRHAAQLDAVHRERPGVRSQARGARGVVDHRLRVVGRARAGLGPRHGRDGRAGRRRIQGVHVRFGSAGVSARR